MIKRSDKELLAAELGDLFRNSKNIFITDYLGLNVGQITELRKRLRANRIKYRVAKNTIFRIAARASGYEGLSEYLQGPTAIAFGTEDPTKSAKTLFEFHKANGKPEVKAFFADGKLYAGSALKELADLPTREELIARVVGAISAPLSNLVGTMDGLIREFCITIDQLAKQRGN